MEAFSALLALFAGNSLVTGEFPPAWTNGWVNNRKAGNLGRHAAHYDAIVMRIITEQAQL